LKLNGCPLRRINQRYLVATSTRLDISKLKIEDRINDDYFRRVKAETSNKKAAKKDGDIFEAKKEEYKPSEERKTDQAAVDKQILEIISKHPDASMLKAYFKHTFSLSKGQFPHQMVF
jgi:large subunit ribosomal protein L6e